MDIMENRFLSLDNIEDIRNNIGFHFTSKQNLEAILNTGLQARLGANSTGALGRAVIPKPYVSYGLEGVLQLYNRFLNLAGEMPISCFQGQSYAPFIQDNIKKNGPNYIMSIVERFEFVRQYMENNVYLMFNSQTSQYEHSISDEQLVEINNTIKNMVDENGDSVVSKINDLNRKIKSLYREDQAKNKNEIEAKVKERNKLVTDIWEKSKKMVDKKRGPLLNEKDDPIIDIIDFNDEKLSWMNYEKNPHNAHTRIVKKDERWQGIPVNPEKMHVFSRDGNRPSNGVEFFHDIYSRVQESDLTRLQTPDTVDKNLLGLFFEYVELVEQYKKNGLLIERPASDQIRDGKKVRIDGSLVVDLSNIQQYPGLEDFSHNAQIFYKEEEKNCGKIIEKLQDDRKTIESKLLAQACTKEVDVAVLNEEADKSFEQLSKKPTEKEIIKRGKE